jgi:hypothetical protein
MDDFVNTIDLLGEEATAAAIIGRTITEFNDNAIIEIGDSAFYNCDKLTRIDLPKVTKLAGSAFRGCKTLTSVSIPNVTDIGGWVFLDCYELSILDSPSATIIGNRCFSSCKKLTTLILRVNQVCALGDAYVFQYSPFNTVGSGATLYVPQELVEDYKNATNWSSLYSAGKCNIVAIEGSEYE